MKNKLILFLAFFAALAAAAADPELLVKIPRITPEKAAELAAAENFWEGDWEGAAVVRNFSNHAMGLGYGSEPTSFYLFHDGENIWAAVVAGESDYSSARAFERSTVDDLTVDEAVQIVIGLDGKISTQFNMGGYDGAYGSIGKCEHLYEMTVNMAGASSRRYDETPLENPRFDSVVFHEQDRWIALFCVPLSSVGLEWEKSPVIHFNMFRFYRGERYGWFLPNFGGYHKLPMAKAELLDFDRNQEAAAEAPPAISVSASSTVRRETGRLDVEYYAAAGEVAAEVPSGNAGAVIQLTVNGKSISAEGSADWPTRLKVPVECEAGSPVTALLTCDGRELLRKEFTAKEPADWRFGVAAEYLEDRVPYPWSSPEFSDGILTLEHGTVDFGDGMFPVAIANSRGVEILAGPITLEAEVDGAVVPVNTRAKVSKTVTAVEMVSEALPGLEIKTRTEYDGFMTIRARFTGMANTVPDSLKLRIPLSKDLAQYVNNSTSQQIIKSGGFGYKGNVPWDIWVGDRNGGMCFTYGHPLFFSPKNGKQLEVNGDEVVLNFVTPDGLRPPADNVYEFHLQFTPFRSDYIPPLDCKYWFEDWSDYQSYPDLKKIPEIKKRVEEAKAEKRDFFVYFGQVMAEDAPEFAKYPTDFTSYPRRSLYKRAYEPGKDVPCSVICFRGEAGDFMLDKIDILAEETGLPGVYLDGPSVPFTCDNLNHPCSRYLPAEWDGSWHTGNVAGQRTYMKRLRGIFDSRGFKTPIWHHTGGYYAHTHFSHCDFYWDGEHLSRYRRGYMLPPDIFSMLYSGYPFGFQGVFLPMFYCDATLTSRKARAWVAPHNVVSAAGVQSSYESYLKINKRNPETKFYQYSDNQPHINILNSNTLCTSYYLADKEAVLISSNIVYNGVQENLVDISGMFPGEELQIRSLNSEDPVVLEDGVLKFTVAERDVKIFHIAPVSTDVSALGLPDPIRKMASAAPAVPLAVQNDIDLGKWHVESGKFAPVAESGLAYGLQSEGGKALMRYAEGLPNGINLKLKFRHSGKFLFRVDGVEITFDYHQAKGWFIDKLDINDIINRSDVSVVPHGRSYSVLDRPVELDVYIIDNRVACFYDGVRILQYGLPVENYENGHTLAIETKDNDWIAFDVEYFGPAAEADMPVWIHPVR